MFGYNSLCAPVLNWNTIYDKSNVNALGTPTVKEGIEHEVS